MVYKEKSHFSCVITRAWLQCMLLCVVVWYQTMNQHKMAKLINDQIKEEIGMLKNYAENDLAQHFIKGQSRDL